MSNIFQYLNQIISINKKIDALLEQKIQSKENILNNLEIDNIKQNSNKNEDMESKDYKPNSKIVNEIKHKKIGKSLNKIIDNENFNKKKSNIQKLNIKNGKKDLSKEKKRLNYNNELLENKYDNSFISSINNKSSITFKDKENNNFTKKENIIINTPDSKKKNDFKKINNYDYFQKKNKNKILVEYHKQKHKIIKDNVDINLYKQYKTLYSINNKRFNNSLEKRCIKNDVTILSKSRDKSKEKKNGKIEEQFKKIYEKFLEDEKKKKENIEKMIKKKEDEEKKIYIFRPIISDKSKKLVEKKSGCKENFITRQNKLLEKHKKNETILKEKIMKEKEDLLNNSFLSRQNLTNREKSRDKFKHIKSRLFDWEEKQKAIINDNSNKKCVLRKEDSDSENDRKTYKIKVNRNINRVINRLYKNDLEKRKQNLEILSQIYYPSFHPLILENKSINNRIKRIKFDDKFKSTNRSTINITSKITLDYNIEEEGEEDKNFVDNDITNLIRNKLFNKNKKKERYRSEKKFNIINNDDIYDIKFVNNLSKKKQNHE